MVAVWVAWPTAVALVVGVRIALIFRAASLPPDARAGLPPQVQDLYFEAGPWLPAILLLAGPPVVVTLFWVWLRRRGGAPA